MRTSAVNPESKQPSEDPGRLTPPGDLAVREQRMRAALEASNLALWDWNLVSGEVFVDRLFFKLLGRDEPDQVLPVEQLARYIHLDDARAFGAAVDDVRQGRAPKLHAEYRAMHADGRWVWLETCGNVTERGASGKALRMTGTHANVTERKQMENALSNTLRVMQALLETLPLPVILRDADRNVTMVNAAWEQMVGRSRDEVIGKTLASMTNRPPTPGHRESDDQIFATRKPLRYETTVQSSDGTVYNILIAKAPLLAADGTITGIASVVTDISEQKRTAAVLERARQSAEAAVQAKSRFLANMSHELRTPLNGVVGMASLLETTALDARQKQFVRTLRSSAEALITLINDVLDLSKAEAGKLELAHVPFDVRRELEQVVGLFSGRAFDKGIDLAAHIGRDVPATIHGDPARLRQVLGNLINNAVKFTDSGAVLVAVNAVREPGAQLRLEYSVTDTGLGVAPDVQKRIFEAFEQADGSVTRRFGGTGLGLAISRQLVELMHGTMGLSSAPEQGSRFHFAIPAGVPPVPSRPPAPDVHGGALVVGLHPVIRGAACEVLASECARVLSVSAPLHALEALKQFGPQTRRVRVVLDAQSTSQVEPTIAGLRAAAGPRQLDFVVLVPPDADHSPLDGATRTLVKPLCTADLLGSITRVDTAQSMSVRALPASGSRGRALVVEDNAVNQEMARAMLDMMGFTVTTASNGEQGVAAAAADPELALIFMDCQMPVMDGLAAARAIRAAETGRRVPIVALTGNAMPGDREACVAAGMDDYLAKPFSLTALRTVVDKWTGTAAVPAALARKV